MTKITLLFTFFVTFYLQTSAQKQRHIWTVGLSPLTLAEPATSLGLNFSYSVNEKITIWSELTGIFKNAYLLPNTWKNIKGYRFLLQPRYFFGAKHNRFIALEFRLKKYSFNETQKLYFVNNSNLSDSISVNNFKETQTLVGGAIIIGKVFAINKNNNFFFEITSGIGIKDRSPKLYISIPANYSQSIIYPKEPNFRPEYESHGTSFYLPITCRFFWKIN